MTVELLLILFNSFFFDVLNIMDSYVFVIKYANSESDYFYI